jgi:endonuclease VIII
VPEGDTIHRAASTLSHALVGRSVTAFETEYAQLARVADDQPIVGRTIEAIVAQGKHLLMRFSGALTLRTHMRMSGSWHIYRPGEKWQRPAREKRILIATDAYVAVAFSVPVAEFLDDRALARAPSLARLGPDLLADDFDPKIARQRLRERPDQPVSEVPLDQSIAAGAGNVYRSEVLFLAGIAPDRLASSVSDADLEALFALTRKLMKANVTTGSIAGATGQIVTYTGLRRTTGRANERDRLWVYGRAGDPCRRCGTPIAYRKTGPDARGLYHCPRCQK